MTQQTPSPDHVARISSLGLVVATGLAGLFVLVAVGMPYFAFSRAWNGFLARTAEAGPLIEAVYLKYYESGEWPESLDTLGPAGIVAVPEGWRYYFDEPNAPPILDVRCALHGRLVYRFRKDGSLDSPGGWRATCEGTPVRHAFSERIPIKPARAR